MIEINLLPGARKKSKSTGGGSSFDVRAFVGSLGERFKDPWLGIAAGGLLVGVAAVGAMWFFQGRTAAALDEQLRVAVQDSARFDAVVKATRTAQAQREHERSSHHRSPSVPVFETYVWISNWAVRIRSSGALARASRVDDGTSDTFIGTMMRRSDPIAVSNSPI